MKEYTYKKPHNYIEGYVREIHDPKMIGKVMVREAIIQQENRNKTLIRVQFTGHLQNLLDGIVVHERVRAYFVFRDSVTKKGIIFNYINVLELESI